MQWDGFCMDQLSPISIAGHAYDAETIDVLRNVLEDCWSDLSETQRTAFPRSLIAQWLLQAAAGGERDPRLLRSKVIEGVLSNVRATR
jgi:hypothetical protein